MSIDLLTANPKVVAALAILDVFPASDATPWFTIDGEDRPR